jgi:hypothetical protein
MRSWLGAKMVGERKMSVERLLQRLRVLRFVSTFTPTVIPKMLAADSRSVQEQLLNSAAAKKSRLRSAMGKVLMRGQLVTMRVGTWDREVAGVSFEHFGRRSC